MSGTTELAQGALSSDITHFSATKLSNMIRSKKVSCEEVMRAYLAKIYKYNSTYNAIVSMPDEDILISQARLADIELSKDMYRGWMHGMPHAIKDLAYSKDLPTSEGSPIIAGTRGTQDSLFVSRIRAAGAIFIGKTNVPEFGYGSQTYNKVFGATRNAYKPSLTAGGSSGGAAVGLATRMLPVADGSDMMGSLRNPAAFNNVIGFRPSRWRVPNYFSGYDNFYQQLSTDGPMGRNVEDMLRLLSIMSGPDERLPLTLMERLPEYEELKPASLNNIKIGWMGDYDGYLPTENGLLKLCEKALEDIGHTGLITESCSPRYDMNRLLNIPIENDFYSNPYINVGSDNYWNGSSEERTFSEESSVGQIFITENQDNDLKQSCKLELNLGELIGKSITDSSGNSNKGLLIGDYKVKKIRKGEPMRRDSFIKVPKKTGNKDGAL